MPEPNGAEKDVGLQLDRVPFSRIHVLLFAILGFGILFDQMEASLTAVLTAVFAMSGSAVSRDAFSQMLTYYFVVGAIGAPALGLLSDRIGRRSALMIAFGGFGTLTMASALIHDFTGFAIARVLSNFMLSAVPPLVYAYMADVLPPVGRGATMMLLGVMSAMGGILAPILTSVGNDIEPFGMEGWRSVMLFGGIAGVTLCLMLLFAVESPRWLAARGRRSEAEAALARFERSRAITWSIPDAPKIAPVTPSAVCVPEPGGLLSAAHRGRFALIVATVFLQIAAVAAFSTLLTSALLAKGYDMEGALGYSGLIYLAMPFGVVAAAVIIDRMARRTLFVGMSVIMSISAIVFGYALEPVILVGSGLVFCFVIASFTMLTQIYCAELFPTRLRGTVAGIAWSAGRLGSVLVPLTFLPVMIDFGPAIAFLGIGSLILLAATLIWLFGPNIRPGTPLA